MNRLTLWSSRAVSLDAFIGLLFETARAMRDVDWSLEAMFVGTRAGPERLVDPGVLAEELELHASTVDDDWRRFAPDHLVKLSNDRGGALRTEIFARRWDARDAPAGSDATPALVELEVIAGGEGARVLRVFDLWLRRARRAHPRRGYAESAALRARAARKGRPSKVGWMTSCPAGSPIFPRFHRSSRDARSSGDQLLSIGGEPLEDTDADRSKLSRTWEVVAPALERAPSAAAASFAVRAAGGAPRPPEARSIAAAPSVLAEPPARMPAVRSGAPSRGKVERALSLAVDLTRVGSVDELLRAEGLSPERWSLTVQAFAARMTLNPRLREAVVALGGRASNALMSPAVALFATAETAFERAIHLAIGIAAGTAPRAALERVGLDEGWAAAAAAFADRLAADPELHARLERARAALEGRGPTP
ncbi:MAG: hypothetical protein U0414_24710 [Polyangiaceae bacterium]